LIKGLQLTEIGHLGNAGLELAQMVPLFGWLICQLADLFGRQLIANLPSLGADLEQNAGGDDSSTPCQLAAIRHDKCDPVHSCLPQDELLIEPHWSSIMWTRHELVQCGFVAVVALTGLWLLSTLL
jgi:hypothetical protein